MNTVGKTFLAARDFLLENREDYPTAYRDFVWPRFEHFNWVLDYFDPMATDNHRTALWIVEEDGTEHRYTFAEMSSRSNQVANFLRAQGVGRGDRIIMMLDNQTALWEIMLAAIKLGAVLIPATPLLNGKDLTDRIERSGASFVVVNADRAPQCEQVPGNFRRISVGGAADGCLTYEEAYDYPALFTPDGPTRAEDPLLLYFTSGTTSKPKLVQHTHQSYPIGHLSTMYWIGLRPGDIHWNIGSPGWAKHAWSNFFAPWNAEATVFIHRYERFDPVKTLETISRCGVTSLCAPPTVWRMIIQQDLQKYPVQLRELVGAGEPLNPEIIERVRAAWGLTLRDGYGQTETTCQIGNPPGQPLKPGSMGRPMPGFRITLLDPDDQPAREGEVGLSLDPRPVGLMTAYIDNPEKTDVVMRAGYYHTGDVATVDEDGYLTFVGRADDVFKASDYRISPFELESVLMEHPAVAEAAVVPSPDPVRLAVPKAFVILKADYEPDRETALSIFRFCRQHLSPFKRIRRLEFSDLPKTISGKIRRVALRQAEIERSEERRELEFFEKDFPELKQVGVE